MASSTCHVFCGTKRIRLERLVRPPLPGTSPELAAAQPRGETLQQLGAAEPRLGATKHKLKLARARSLTRVCPKPTRQIESCLESRLSEAGAPQAILPIPLTARAKRRQRQVSGELYATEDADPAVRDTRPNTRVKPRREAV